MAGTIRSHPGNHLAARRTNHRILNRVLNLDGLLLAKLTWLSRLILYRRERVALCLDRTLRASRHTSFHTSESLGILRRNDLRWVCLLSWMRLPAVPIQKNLPVPSVPPLHRQDLAVRHTTPLQNTKVLHAVGELLQKRLPVQLRQLLLRLDTPRLEELRYAPPPRRGNTEVTTARCFSHHGLKVCRHRACTGSLRRSSWHRTAVASQKYPPAKNLPTVADMQSHMNAPHADKIIKATEMKAMGHASTRQRKTPK